MSGYPLFFGEPGEDAELFLSNFRMALHIKGVVGDQECLDMFELVLRRDASTWFQSLPAPARVDYRGVIQLFRDNYFTPLNTQKLWQEIVAHRQKNLEDYLSYKQEFLRLWTLWLRSLPNPRDGAEFLKKERFIARLYPSLKLQVESGDPTTFDVVEARATKKLRKMRCILGGGFIFDDSKPREEVQSCTQRELPEVTVEVIEKLNESLNNLSIHFAQAVEQKGQTKRAEEREPRPRRLLQCWNCGESGHGMYNCPWPRGEPGKPNINYPVMNAGEGTSQQQPMLLQRPNATRPPPRGVEGMPPLSDPNVHVVEVTTPKEADIEANGIKRGRGKGKEKEGVTSQSESGRAKKVKENKEVKRRRRRINLQISPAPACIPTPPRNRTRRASNRCNRAHGKRRARWWGDRPQHWQSRPHRH